MGLDMYLNKKTYIWNKDGETLTISHPRYKFAPEKVKYVIEGVGYWRKANAIHKWFVDNIQDGEDDCGEYYVSRKKMEELLGTVNKVIEASKLVDGEINNGKQYQEGEWKDIKVEGKYIKDPTVASELLPTASGFFFGGTDYDEYYLEDLTHTRDILREALTNEDSNGEYEYHSSW